MGYALTTVMKCSNKECQASGTVYMRYLVKDKGLNDFCFCETHAQLKRIKFEGMKLNYNEAPSCPCCVMGFVAQWAHRDHGMCYRCNGKGYWGDVKKIRHTT